MTDTNQIGAVVGPLERVGGRVYQLEVNFELPVTVGLVVGVPLPRGPWVGGTGIPCGVVDGFMTMAVVIAEDGDQQVARIWLSNASHDGVARIWDSEKSLDSRPTCIGGLLVLVQGDGVARTSVGDKAKGSAVVSDWHLFLGRTAYEAWTAHDAMWDRLVPLPRWNNVTEFDRRPWARFARYVAYETSEPAEIAARDGYGVYISVLPNVPTWVDLDDTERECWVSSVDAVRQAIPATGAG